ncbi:MAG: Bax inhibitor-1/YccA family protein [Nibricoccus sp.]
MIAGLVLGLIIAFTRVTTPFLIVPYGAVEGVFLGAVSYFANQQYPGIALEAIIATLGCFFAVLWLYSINVLRATPAFVKIISAALMGIAALYLVSLVSRLFGHPLTFLHDSSTLSIGISVAVIIVASLSFVIDFAAIDEAVAQGVDSRQGWRFAFCLLVGLVWLYLEILRLLSKLRSRN